jgi:predicted alpha/beta superfamily hydrolase
MRNVRRTLPVLLVIFVLALLAIGGFYYIQSSRAESDAARYEQWSKSLKPVKVEFVVTPPPNTPKDQFVYVRGSEPKLGAWDGAGVQLTRSEDGKYRGSVELTSGIEHAFKVNRGNWATVERTADDQEVPNHTFRADKPETIEVTVAAWADNGTTVPGRITRTGDVRMYPKFHSSILANERTIAVYLPPAYEESGDTRYPVLYMHDGNNLFDSNESFQGIEWQVDETAERMIAQKQIPPVIIVGIYNGGEFRDEEFTPFWSNVKGKPGKADQYAKFVVEEVKPFIDATFRTMPDRAHTSLAGSQLGGMVTLFMAKNNKDTFGQFAVLTPRLRTSDKVLLDQLGNDWSWAKGARIWIDQSDKGGKEYPGPDPIADAKAFVAKLQAAQADLKYTEFPGTEHNESAWQKRVDQVLTFLYGTTPTTNSSASAR